MVSFSLKKRNKKRKKKTRKKKLKYVMRGGGELMFTINIPILLRGVIQQRYIKIEFDEAISRGFEQTNPISGDGEMRTGEVRSFVEYIITELQSQTTEKIREINHQFTHGTGGMLSGGERAFGIEYGSKSLSIIPNLENIRQNELFLSMAQIWNILNDMVQNTMFYTLILYGVIGIHTDINGNDPTSASERQFLTTINTNIKNDTLVSDMMAKIGKRKTPTTQSVSFRDDLDDEEDICTMRATQQLIDKSIRNMKRKAQQIAKNNEDSIPGMKTDPNYKVAIEKEAGKYVIKITDKHRICKFEDGDMAAGNRPPEQTERKRFLMINLIDIIHDVMAEGDLTYNALLSIKLLVKSYAQIYHFGEMEVWHGLLVGIENQGDKNEWDGFKTLQGEYWEKCKQKYESIPALQEEYNQLNNLPSNTKKGSETYAFNPLQLLRRFELNEPMQPVLWDWSSDEAEWSNLRINMEDIFKEWFDNKYSKNQQARTVGSAIEEWFKEYFIKTTPNKYMLNPKYDSKGINVDILGDWQALKLSDEKVMPYGGGVIRGDGNYLWYYILGKGNSLLDTRGFIGESISIPLEEESRDISEYVQGFGSGMGGIVTILINYFKIFRALTSPTQENFGADVVAYNIEKRKYDKELRALSLISKYYLYYMYTAWCDKYTNVSTKSQLLKAYENLFVLKNEQGEGSLQGERYGDRGTKALNYSIQMNFTDAGDKISSAVNPLWEKMQGAGVHYTAGATYLPVEQIALPNIVDKASARIGPAVNINEFGMGKIPVYSGDNEDIKFQDALLYKIELTQQLNEGGDTSLKIVQEMKTPDNFEGELNFLRNFNTLYTKLLNDIRILFDEYIDTQYLINRGGLPDNYKTSQRCSVKNLVSLKFFYLLLFITFQHTVVEDDGDKVLISNLTRYLDQQTNTDKLSFTTTNVGLRVSSAMETSYLKEFLGDKTQGPLKAYWKSDTYPDEITNAKVPNLTELRTEAHKELSQNPTQQEKRKKEEAKRILELLTCSPFYQISMNNNPSLEIPDIMKKIKKKQKKKKKKEEDEPASGFISKTQSAGTKFRVKKVKGWYGKINDIINEYISTDFEWALKEEGIDRFLGWKKQNFTACGDTCSPFDDDARIRQIFEEDEGDPLKLKGICLRTKVDLPSENTKIAAGRLCKLILLPKGTKYTVKIEFNDVTNKTTKHSHYIGGAMNKARLREFLSDNFEICNEKEPGWGERWKNDDGVDESIDDPDPPRIYFTGVNGEYIPPDLQYLVRNTFDAEGNNKKILKVLQSFEIKEDDKDDKAKEMFTNLSIGGQQFLRDFGLADVGEVRDRINQWIRENSALFKLLYNCILFDFETADSLGDPRFLGTRTSGRLNFGGNTKYGILALNSNNTFIQQAFDKAIETMNTEKDENTSAKQTITFTSPDFEGGVSSNILCGRGAQLGPSVSNVLEDVREIAVLFLIETGMLNLALALKIITNNGQVFSLSSRKEKEPEQQKKLVNDIFDNYLNDLTGKKAGPRQHEKILELIRPKTQTYFNSSIKPIIHGADPAVREGLIYKLKYILLGLLLNLKTQSDGMQIHMMKALKRQFILDNDNLENIYHMYTYDGCCGIKALIKGSPALFQSEKGVLISFYGQIGEKSHERIIVKGGYEKGPDGLTSCLVEKKSNRTDRVYNYQLAMKKWYDTNIGILFDELSITREHAGKLELEILNKTTNVRTVYKTSITCFYEIMDRVKNKAEGDAARNKVYELIVDSGIFLEDISTDDEGRYDKNFVENRTGWKSHIINMAITIYRVLSSKECSIDEVYWNEFFNDASRANDSFPLTTNTNKTYGGDSVTKLDEAIDFYEVDDDDYLYLKTQLPSLLEVLNNFVKDYYDITNREPDIETDNEWKSDGDYKREALFYHVNYQVVNIIHIIVVLITYILKKEVDDVNEEIVINSETLDELGLEASQVDNLQKLKNCKINMLKIIKILLKTCDIFITNKNTTSASITQPRKKVAFGSSPLKKQQRTSSSSSASTPGHITRQSSVELKSSGSSPGRARGQSVEAVGLPTDLHSRFEEMCKLDAQVSGVAIDIQSYLLYKLERYKELTKTLIRSASNVDDCNKLLLAVQQVPDLIIQINKEFGEIWEKKSVQSKELSVIYNNAVVKVWNTLMRAQSRLTWTDPDKKGGVHKTYHFRDAVSTIYSKLMQKKKEGDT